MKANNRNLIDYNDFEFLKLEINKIGKMLNSYIKSIGNSATNQINEPEEKYGNSYDEPIFQVFNSNTNDQCLMTND